MELKSFIAPDMRRALNLVSEELGADAVILSNKKIPEGIEIVAAIDYDPDLYMQYAMQQQKQAGVAEATPLQGQAQPQPQVSVPTAAPAAPSAPAPHPAAVAPTQATAEKGQVNAFDSLMQQQQANESEALAWLRKHKDAIVTRDKAPKKGQAGEKKGFSFNGQAKVKEITQSLQRKANKAKAAPAEPLANQERINQEVINRELMERIQNGEPQVAATDEFEAKVSISNQASKQVANQSEIEQLKQELQELKKQLESDGQPEQSAPVAKRERRRATANDNSRVERSQRASKNAKASAAKQAAKQTAVERPSAEETVTNSEVVTPAVAKEKVAEPKKTLAPEEMKTVRALKKKHAQQLQQLQGELDLMKELFQNSMQQNQWEMLHLKKPETVQLFKKMRSLGLSSSLTDDYVQKMSEREIKVDDEMLLSDIERSIPIYPDAKPGATRLIALVGPSGSGKTTTIAKLAAQFAIKHGSDKLAIITTDTFRLGAFEQLKVLGKILNVSIRVANEKRSIESILQTMGKKSLVLIDTAGIGHEEVSWKSQLEQLAPIQDRLESFLMLPATSHEKVLRKSVEAYSALKLSGCVLSKLDETQSLGESLSVAIEKRLPIAYVTNGQEIPKDIQTVDKKSLVETMAELANSDPYSELELAISFHEMAEGEQPNRMNAASINSLFAQSA